MQSMQTFFAFIKCVFTTEGFGQMKFHISFNTEQNKTTKQDHALFNISVPVVWSHQPCVPPDNSIVSEV